MRLRDDDNDDIIHYDYDNNHRPRHDVNHDHGPRYHVYFNDDGSIFDFNLDYCDDDNCTSDHYHLVADDDARRSNDDGDHRRYDDDVSDGERLDDDYDVDIPAADYSTVYAAFLYAHRLNDATHGD
jgi:hypothetical protein